MNKFVCKFVCLLAGVPVHTSLSNLSLYNGQFGLYSTFFLGGARYLLARGTQSDAVQTSLSNLALYNGQFVLYGTFFLGGACYILTRGNQADAVHTNLSNLALYN